MYRVTFPTSEERERVFPIERPIGAMWPTTSGWMIALPCEQEGHRCLALLDERWTVTGQAPDLTARPSIHCQVGPGHFHGFLTKGWLQ